ncbi:MAG: hypothetical protein M1524_00210 [Patescibacteria group bacterium]|nr:hypothetical protein [Patescibacteria group bacterium]
MPERLKCSYPGCVDWCSDAVSHEHGAEIPARKQYSPGDKSGEYPVGVLEGSVESCGKVTRHGGIEVCKQAGFVRTA